MISVCMAAYNGEKYIRQQIKSIIPQLGNNDELIISDDGSSDSTIEIIQSFGDNRIKLYYNNGHDYTNNFENAIKMSKGDIIMLSDQDDIWMPNKVEKVVNAIRTNNCDLVITDAKVIDASGSVITESYFKSQNVKKGFLVNWIRTRYIGSCMAFKRSILKKVLDIPGKSKYIAHDYWIACICEMYYKVFLLDEPLMYYVRHPGTTSPGITEKSKLSIGERLFKRLYTMIYLLSRVTK